ncbi:hypothetical protein SAMN05444392_104131 [Seinonella peptonophila]|uniref:Hydrolase n=1 Tax=Seinonella peptonophila TaxID=112248 RepID=A0A1M4X5L2_9BACL|nr:hypothetical protein [Seinonella peptonophila]SHE88663.1 hypothetical protein SAMN05444392_104131 [Seinonella peptonophila]
MDKKRYYISIDTAANAGQIHEMPVSDDPYYDYEVEATPEQIAQLESLFVEMEESDFRSFLKAHIPYETQERMQESWTEDAKLSAIYRMIYKLGTDQTKVAIEQAGLPH